MNYKYFASESVCAGHPDKVCDQTSDAILDFALSNDPRSRVAIECLVSHELMVVAGEVTCSKKIPYEKIARSVIKDLGYSKKIYNFHYKNSPVSINVHQQSPEISQGVDTGGAGDQGMMFGYATNETPELMPLPITLAHRLAERMDQVREKKVVPYLRPDGKTEVVIKYKNGKPQDVERVVLAVPHEPKIKPDQIKNDLRKYVVNPVLRKYHFKSNGNLIVNGTGSWIIGGPSSDTGETGRKIIVDTYGGMGRHGGGCFSGKDPTKVDRSAAYACRFLAKNIVAHKLADRCEVQVAYVIGQAQPLARAIDTFGTAKKPQKVIEDFAWKLLDLSVPKILEQLDLRRPIYRRTATYGHFGRKGFPWEKIVAK